MSTLRLSHSYARRYRPRQGVGQLHPPRRPHLRPAHQDGDEGDPREPTPAGRGGRTPASGVLLRRGPPAGPAAPQRRARRFSKLPINPPPPFTGPQLAPRPELVEVDPRDHDQGPSIGEGGRSCGQRRCRQSSQGRSRMSPWLMGNMFGEADEVGLGLRQGRLRATHRSTVRWLTPMPSLWRDAPEVRLGRGSSI